MQNSKNSNINETKLKKGKKFNKNYNQMHNSVGRKSSLKSEIKYCFKNEGITGFYKGMSFPLYSVPLVNAVVFAVYELSKKIMRLDDESQMNLKQGIISGGIAGLVNCVVVTPVELVKCRLQIQSENKNISYYKGVYDCIYKILKNNGLPGLYTGNVATILREVPAYAAQFGGYYYAKTKIAKFRKKDIKDLSNLDVMIAGSIGGYCCWQFSYPQDVIKTQIQVRKNYHGHEHESSKLSFINCAKRIYAQNGFQGFWRGFSACSIRAVTSNSVLFLSYEKSKNMLSRVFSIDEKCL